MEGVGFCLDGGCFTHKMNPFDQSRGPVAMTWRNPGQGFDFSFTGKGSHEGTGEEGLLLTLWQGEHMERV